MCVCIMYVCVIHIYTVCSILMYSWCMSTAHFGLNVLVPKLKVKLRRLTLLNLEQCWYSGVTSLHLPSSAEQWRITPQTKLGKLMVRRLLFYGSE